MVRVPARSGVLPQARGRSGGQCGPMHPVPALHQEATECLPTRAPRRVLDPIWATYRGLARTMTWSGQEGSTAGWAPVTSICPFNSHRNMGMAICLAVSMLRRI